MRETEIQKQCLDYLHMIGIDCWRNNNMAVPNADGTFRRFVGRKGRPDIEGILSDGRYFGCEMKQPGKELSVDQWDFHQMIARNNGFICTVHSIDELIEDLKEIGL